MSLLVRDVMLENPVVLTPRTPLRVAAAHLARARDGHLVVAAEDRIHGLVTVRRLVLGAEAAAEGVPVNGVGDLASRRFVLAREAEPLAMLAERLVRAGARHAVVCDAGGEVVGVLTTRELAHGTVAESHFGDAVDAASEASFPASDAPAWTGAVAG